MPTPLLSGRSPYEYLHGQFPNYSLLRVFGSSCFVLLPRKDRTKLSARCVLCVFLRYEIHQKGYRCYDPITKKLYVSRHVTFFERLPYFTLPSKAAPVAKEDLIYLDHFSFDVPTEKYSSTLDIADMPLPAISPEVFDCPPPPPTSSLPSLISPSPLVYSRHRAASHIPSSSSVAPSSDSENPDPPSSWYPTRSRHPPVKFGLTNTCFSSSYHSFLSRIHTYFEPRSYKEACNDPHWVDAMNDELTALAKTQTWELTPLPDGKNLIGYKWVNKVKTHSDGSLERYKSRLVAKGFSQEYGIDYEETFAPVAKMTTVRTLISVAAVHQWSLYQLDVKNAFLNGYLSEEVYIRPPPGLSPPPPGLVYRLRCALYSLKQFPRAWYARFQAIVLQIGFQPSVHDLALFVRHTSHGLVFLLLYVDNMIITGSDSVAISNVKDHLFREFEIKDLAHFGIFLGLRSPLLPKAIFCPKLSILLIFFIVLISWMTKLLILLLNFMLSSQLQMGFFLRILPYIVSWWVA
ncbi:retrovirus-related Pol polyprotein from transposon RE2 isoform X1 [Actinidia eriantha]|uniref:retrovirus-related Pol polyprotein from transposon RE2 isoform X1 n=1 Tax=Actinidia eriantha TaxID=165200 RepID=UPI00258D3E4F|nr:retrovirus-related Pol polyprotein from transposon RE2 isoform X1 [Actinidia eriantha]XP_057470915.1 retrovirus-related Pol polyprotein from transposon RE2 isoform X1 [Actinidia eriantha]